MTNQEINLAVATIAGWTDIEVYQRDRNLTIKTYQGTNQAHPELGCFVPNYCESIDAIANVFIHLHLDYELTIFGDGRTYAKHYGVESNKEAKGKTTAIALCNLLLEINPAPIKPVPKPK